MKDETIGVVSQNVHSCSERYRLATTETADCEVEVRAERFKRTTKRCLNASFEAKRWKQRVGIAEPRFGSQGAEAQSVY